MDNGSNFKNWFDAIWLGDEEHGQFIPNQKDEDYDEYLEKFTLSYGAYKYALSHRKERNAELEKDAERYRWLRDGNNEKKSEATHIAQNCYGLEWDAVIDKAIEAMKGSNDDK